MHKMNTTVHTNQEDYPGCHSAIYTANGHMKQSLDLEKQTKRNKTFIFFGTDHSLSISHTCGQKATNNTKANAQFCVPSFQYTYRGDWYLGIVLILCRLCVGLKQRRRRNARLNFGGVDTLSLYGWTADTEIHSLEGGRWDLKFLQLNEWEAVREVDNCTEMTERGVCGGQLSLGNGKVGRGWYFKSLKVIVTDRWLGKHVSWPFSTVGAHCHKEYNVAAENSVTLPQDPKHTRD